MIKKAKLLKKVQNLFILILIILSLFLFKELLYKKNHSINPNEIKIHYIDVGQGDAILVQVNNKNLLIDSGPKSDKKKLTNYLDSIYIPQFDYVIATHPHEDHIGNMSYIISNYKILNFYSPKVESNTNTFEGMAEALSRKNIKIKILKANNKTIDLGENTLVEVFSPNLDSYDNLNNYSPIIKIYYGNNSFLFTGDAEENVEAEVISKSFNLKSDILKIGHHGSSTSTSKDFLEKINPKITIISVGKNNSYGHPTKETLDKIKNTTVYRTDINRSIIITSDGKTLKSSFK